MSERFASPADLEACRRAIRGGSKSFYAASLLLPSGVRADAYALYGFCRRADDAVDDGRNPGAACIDLSRRLDAIYAGRPGPDPVDRAFADLVEARAIPRALPGALIEGFVWDAQGRRFDTIGDVRAYGARVAGTVGVMMTLVMGVRDPHALARASDLGVAMQLTNIARDVGEDARAGRLYLPRQWMEEAGLDPDAFLAAPCFSPQLAQVIARVLDEADRLYERARPGVALLPSGCRAAIHAASRIYRDIGGQIRRAGFDSVTRRAATSKRRKLALAAAGLLDAAGAGRQDAGGPLAETRFLVQAVPPAPPRAPDLAWWRLGEHWGRMFEILHALEQREQAALRQSMASRQRRG
ncbi:phytoene/squalene synthase family protein [Alkalicaulis satelles]|nr:phytoene/squalene synthase family protein [Alkalicaulis satelles]